MTRETLQHLNTNTLIGHTDQPGTAWHYRAEEQGAESNHGSVALTHRTRAVRVAR